MIRLDKYISQVTDYSRKEVKRILKEELVTVDGLIIKDPSLKISDQQVCIDGEAIGAPAPRYFMVHKPAGYVSVTKNPDHPSILELIDEPNLDKLQIAGRLDVDTTGLLLITDDGQWNHAITSPKRSCKKTYYVETQQDITEDATQKLTKGILLTGELKPTLPASLELLYNNECRLTIEEGRYHQVKRMFAAVDNHVVTLHRERVGAIHLDDELQEGEYRPLTEEEINSVWALK